MFVVPTMFVRLLALPEAVRRKYDLSSLENVLHAGAPCAPDVKVRMIDWWGPVIFEYYGSTEAGPLTFCGRSEEHTSELQSLLRITYAVFCSNTKKQQNYVHPL